MVHNLTHFQLTSDTTYEQYVYAIESIEADMHNLLPPEFPEVWIWFRYNHPDFEQKFHRDCPGAGDWKRVIIFRMFSQLLTASPMKRELSFFPNSCPDPLHIN